VSIVIADILQLNMHACRTGVVGNGGGEQRPHQKPGRQGMEVGRRVPTPRLVHMVVSPLDIEIKKLQKDPGEKFVAFVKT